MKKKNIVSGMILFGIIVLGVISVNAQSFYAYSNEIAYTEKSIFDKQDDGWIYGFEIIYENTSDKRTYIFDGYNLKYEESDEYYIPYIDAQTGEELSRIKSQFATLSTSKKYREDINSIDNYFDSKQFNEIITLEDLQDLNVKNIDKSYLVKLFNQAFNSEMKNTPGKYIDSQFLTKETISSSDDNLSGKWQVICLQSYGDIFDINIEFISDKGEYILDQNKKMSLYSNDNFLNQIENVEKSIISSQEVRTDVLEDNGITNNEDLKKLLNGLAEKLKSDTVTSNLK